MSDSSNDFKNGFLSFMASAKLSPTRESCYLNKKVTVVIASYNDISTLQFSYDSIVNQSYRNLEIIVVDDCGEQKVSDFLKVSPSIKTSIIRHTTNLGPYASRNTGIEKMKGEYIAFHDADDWAHPSKIEFQVKFLENARNNHILALYHRHVRVTNEGDIMPENNLSYIGDGPITGFFRKELFSQIGNFYNLRTRGDIEYKNRIIAFYGKSSVEQQEFVSVIALDWLSNSKKYNFLHTKNVEMKKIKASFLERSSFLKSA